VDALLNLEGSYRFGGIGGFVNISRHRDNLLINGLDAFSFGKRKILCGRITLGKRRLCCRLVGAWQRRSAIGIATFHGIGIRTCKSHQHYRKTARFTSRTMKLRNAALRFFGASLRGPEFSHPTSGDGLSPTRTSRGDFIPTTGGNILI
jgi:hypothetical protein